MNKRELVSRIAEDARVSGFRKSVVIPQQVFTISDEHGNSRNITIKGEDKEVLYTKKDIDTIIKLLVDNIVKVLKEGEHITIRGFGTFWLSYRKGNVMINHVTKEKMVIPDRYITRFTVGEHLKKAAKAFNASVIDGTTDVVPSKYGASPKASEDGG